MDNLPKSKHHVLKALLFVLAAAVFASTPWGKTLLDPLLLKFTGGQTVEDVLDRLENSVESRVREYCAQASAAYPPEALYLLVLKRERQLEIWAEEAGAKTHLHTYPILGMSGGPGPKLREGDGQVPEGLYGVVALHPNSAFHLSLKIGYPNAFDQAMGEDDGRERLGGDIFIHGGSASIGCIAIGDPAIEELFVLAARTGIRHIQVISVPHDFRADPVPTALPGSPIWTTALHEELAGALREFPNPHTH